jgi:hypothetical protein
MALFALKAPKSPAIPARSGDRTEHKSEIQLILSGDAQIVEEVGAAQAIREQQDQLVNAIEADPIQLARLDTDGYEAALRKRTGTHMALGKILIKQAAYREQHNLDSLRHELAAICEEEKQEAQQEHRYSLGVAALTVLADLRRATESYRAYCGLIDQAHAEWPREADAVMRNYPLLPVGVLSPNGLRSIQGFWSDSLMSADSELLPPDDPERLRVEQARAMGREHRIFRPSMVWSD